MRRREEAAYFQEKEREFSFLFSPGSGNLDYAAHADSCSERLHKGGERVGDGDGGKAGVSYISSQKIRLRYSKGWKKVKSSHGEGSTDLKKFLHKVGKYPFPDVI